MLDEQIGAEIEDAAREFRRKYNDSIDNYRPDFDSLVLAHLLDRLEIQDLDLIESESEISQEIGNKIAQELQDWELETRILK